MTDTRRQEELTRSIDEMNRSLDEMAQLGREAVQERARGGTTARAEIVRRIDEMSRSLDDLKDLALEAAQERAGLVRVIANESDPVLLHDALRQLLTPEQLAYIREHPL